MRTSVRWPAENRCSAYVLVREEPDDEEDEDNGKEADDDDNADGYSE
jgi:hypothetical protein